MKIYLKVATVLFSFLFLGCAQKEVTPNSKVEVRTLKKMNIELKDKSALSIYKELIVNEALKYCSNNNNLIKHNDSYPECIFRYKNSSFTQDIKSLGKNIKMTANTWLKDSKLETYNILAIRYGEDYEFILKLYHDNLIEMLDECKQMTKSYMKPTNPKFSYCLKLGL